MHTSIRACVRACVRACLRAYKEYDGRNNIVANACVHACLRTKTTTVAKILLPMQCMHDYL